ncbi:hypothetical protein [Chitinophaga filiformis]|uniref:Uncharacterized protein n=1 Tax=Chitinophaga filiformis TaxID=104663 RepID=A0ABY4I8P6_CHIFI|nr:hypothetical protein [Chitinophaga filiformis]UPK72455.1 hypothetical protein MYF79_14275 [Chitinophaga filiformis]
MNIIINDIEKILRQKLEIERQSKELESKLHQLGEKLAEHLCPFQVNQLVHIGNRQGRVTEIRHLCFQDVFVDFFVYKDILNASSFETNNSHHFQVFKINEREFAFTWEISGNKIKKNGKIGKRFFKNVNPTTYHIMQDMRLLSKLHKFIRHNV